MLNGFVHADFWRVARVLKKQIPRNSFGGAACCVYHHGEKVVDVWGGTRDEAGQPWEEDTLALSYSTTKGVASTLIHILVDRGLLDYDEPVARYWPEFAAAGKQHVTLRQLMCHEAGLYPIRSLVDHASRMLDWSYMCDALAAAAPVHAPGAQHGYHGLTYGWLVGEIAQRVTGKPFSELLAAEIAQPLGLDGLYCGLPEDQRHRRARLIQVPGATMPNDRKRSRRLASMNRFFARLRIPVDLKHIEAALMPIGADEFDFNAESVVSASIPAANGMFTARSLARMYAALSAGGELDGVRLLSRETLARATRIQNRGLDRVVPMQMNWRLGYHRAMTFGVRVPRGFGHAGYGGSGAWADPDRRLSVALTLNSGVGTPVGDLRIVKIGSAAARAADRR
jgi:CubicO group peptidase (beta-lactamase class C family)